jgi:hypothetical protein
MRATVKGIANGVWLGLLTWVILAAFALAILRRVGVLP